MRLLHILFSIFVSAQYCLIWTTATFWFKPISSTLFWPEPEHISVIPRPKWMWPHAAQGNLVYRNVMRPVAADPVDYKPAVPNKATPKIYDQENPDQLTPASEVTPDRFGSSISTTKNRPFNVNLMLSDQQFESISGSIPPPISLLDSGLKTTTEAWTFPPTTKDAIRIKIDLSVCINNCVTDKSVKSVCGSDNKTYPNRQYLDCAQQCGQKIRLDYTGRCIPNPPSK